MPSTSYLIDCGGEGVKHVLRASSIFKRFFLWWMMDDAWMKHVHQLMASFITKVSLLFVSIHIMYFVTNNESLMKIFVDVGPGKTDAKIHHINPTTTPLSPTINNCFANVLQLVQIECTSLLPYLLTRLVDAVYIR